MTQHQQITYGLVYSPRGVPIIDLSDVRVEPAGRTLTKDAVVWNAWADDLWEAADSAVLLSAERDLIERAVVRVEDAIASCAGHDPVTVTFPADEVAALDRGDWLSDETFADAAEWMRA